MIFIININQLLLIINIMGYCLKKCLVSGPPGPVHTTYYILHRSTYVLILIFLVASSTRIYFVLELEVCMMYAQLCMYYVQS